MPRAGTTRVTGRKSQLVGGTEEARMQAISRGVADETGRDRVNKRELIGKEINCHPDWPTERIIASLKDQGLRVTARLVNSIRDQFQTGVKPRKRAAKNPRK